LDAGSGGWSKGEVTTDLQLYRLDEDIGETQNLAPAFPGEIEQIKEMFETLINRGRSTPGPRQNNDVEVKRYLN
jgi:hypothetical protein